MFLPLTGYTHQQNTTLPLKAWQSLFLPKDNFTHFALDFLIPKDIFFSLSQKSALSTIHLFSEKAFELT